MKVINIFRASIDPKTFQVTGDQSGRETIIGMFKSLPKIKPFVFSNECDELINLNGPFDGLYLPFSYCSFEMIEPVEMDKTKLMFNSPLLKMDNPHLVGVLVRENADLSIDDVKLYADISGEHYYKTQMIHDSYKNYEEFWKLAHAKFYLTILYNRKCEVGMTRVPVKVTKKGRDPEFVKRLVVISNKKSIKNEFKSFGKIDWKHQWRVRGHWRKISPNMVGKDREGEYVIVGNTWVKDFIKGEGPLIEKTRIIKGEKCQELTKS